MFFDAFAKSRCLDTGISKMSIQRDTIRLVKAAQVCKRRAGLIADLTHGYGLDTLLFMETSVTIDADLLSKAMQNANGQTERQLVENALHLFAIQNRQSDVRKYRGKLQWEGDLDELRAAKWSL